MLQNESTPTLKSVQCMLYQLNVHPMYVAPVLLYSQVSLKLSGGGVYEISTVATFIYQMYQVIPKLSCDTY